MQEKQATGIDTRAMIPMLLCIFLGISELLFPWVSILMLQYGKREIRYSLWNLSECSTNLQNWGCLFRFLAAATVLLLILAVLSYRWREKTVLLIRISSGAVFLTTVLFIFAAYRANWFLNMKLGRENSFINMTAHSYVRLTAYPYGQLLLSAAIFLMARRCLDTKKDDVWIPGKSRGVREDKRMGKRTKAAAILILIAIPLCIFFGIFFLDNKSSSFIALCIIGLSMIPFFMIFEDRKPQARELILIAVMAAIAVAGRVAFFMIPQFKPVTAIVIITGVGLGAEAGFLTGAVAGFVSNFFFGQGPWTPWQMFAFGIIGFLAGVLFRGTRKKYAAKRWVLCSYGGIATLFIYGLIMDTSSVAYLTGNFRWETLLAMYISGFPFNVIHGISTIIFLFFMAEPMGQKLNRIKKKYGILEV